MSAFRIADWESVKMISDPAFKLFAAKALCVSAVASRAKRLVTWRGLELFINCFIHPYIRMANRNLARKAVDFTNALLRICCARKNLQPLFLALKMREINRYRRKKGAFRHAEATDCL